LHPELIGKNQINYRDPSWAFAVQEEINKSKAGGGWLKGRWRKNPNNGKYQCRRIYILPVEENYFIGSWYHYDSGKEGVCVT
jgi:signal transduction histidine kinase